MLQVLRIIKVWGVWHVWEGGVGGLTLGGGVASLLISLLLRTVKVWGSVGGVNLVITLSIVVSPAALGLASSFPSPPHTHLPPPLPHLPPPL